MAQRLIWSPRAASHLESICDYIAEDSGVYARIFAQKVLDIIRSIPDFPEIGRVVPEYGDQKLRERLYRNYRIVYRLNADSIEIVAICHGARLLTNVLPSDV